MKDRLTKERVLALLSAAARGIDEWEIENEDGDAPHDQDDIRDARIAFRVIWNRYFGEEAK